MIEIILACTISTLVLTASIGVYFFIRHQRQIEDLKKIILNERIETNTQFRLLEDRHGKEFNKQIQKMESLSAAMDQQTAAALEELELRFKGFKDNFMNNY